MWGVKAGCVSMDEAQIIHGALAGRRSIRAYLDRAVAPETVRRVLASAATAPSGNNIQPWLVEVVTGTAKRRLTEAILAAEPSPAADYPYYPEAWFEPYLSRRRQVGWSLYGLIGVKKGDIEGSRAHHDRNFDFFGAPAGLILSVDRRLGHGAYIDAGLFLQSLALAAVAEGLGTCIQAAFASYHDTIRDVLGLSSERKVLCGVALGYPDPHSPLYGLRPPRLNPSAFATFHGG
jgi:nitroreductase